MSGANERSFLVQHESCECKCDLNEKVCNSKQKWCECKEFDDWGSCEKGCTWDSSTCD